MNGKTDNETEASVHKSANINDKSDATPKEPFNLVKLVKSFFAFFTIEPFLLCYILPNILCTLVLSKLNLEKACRVDLNYSEEVCLKVVAAEINDNITIEAVGKASILVADMTSWRDPLQTGIPALFILFIGAWSDKTGNRKILLLLPLIGEILAIGGLLLGTYYFLEWPLWVMGLIEASSSIFTGGLPVALMGSYSYIADVTTADSRTFRIGVMAIIVTMGIPLGTSISGVLTDAVGYYGVFGISLAVYIVGLIYTMLRVQDIRRTKIEGTFWYKLAQFFHPINVWETISIVFTSRGVQLAQILLVIWAHIVIMGPAAGEGSILYLYTLNKYNMNLVDLSLFATYSLLMGIAGTAIAVTVFSKWLKFHDTVLGFIATASKVLSSVIYGLAPTRDWFFVGPVVDVFGNSGVTAIRSLGTKIVKPDDVGKMCSLIGFIDSVVPAIYVPMYNKMLSNTLNTFPGAVYILGAVMTAPDFVIFVVLYIFHKRKQRDIVRQREMKEMHAYENDVTAL